MSNQKCKCSFTYALDRMSQSIIIINKEMAKKYIHMWPGVWGRECEDLFIFLWNFIYYNTYLQHSF